jgi:serine/threonine protein kinase
MMRDTTEKEKETIATELELLKKLKHVNIVTFRDSFIDS